jgi:hypothetical protein
MGLGNIPSPEITLQKEGDHRLKWWEEVICWPIRINYLCTLLQLLLGPRLSLQIFVAAIVDCKFSDQ